MSTPTPAPSAGELLTVTQADEELLSHIVSAVSCARTHDELDGKYDDLLAQVARHRLAHSAPADAGGGVATLREALERAELAAARAGINVMDPDAMERYRDEPCGNPGHDRVSMNYNSQRRLVALIDWLALNPVATLPTTNQQHPQSNDKEG